MYLLIGEECDRRLRRGADNVRSDAAVEGADPFGAPQVDDRPPHRSKALDVGGLNRALLHARSHHLVGICEKGGEHL